MKRSFFFLSVLCLCLLVPIRQARALGMSPPEFWVTETLDYTSSVPETVWLTRDPFVTGELTLRPAYDESDSHYFTDTGDLVIPADQQGGYYTFYVAPGYAAGGDYLKYFIMNQVADSDGLGGASAGVLGGLMIKVHFSVVAGNKTLGPTASTRDVSNPTGQIEIPPAEPVTETPPVEVPTESPVDQTLPTETTLPVVDEPVPTESNTPSSEVVNQTPEAHRVKVLNDQDLTVFFDNYFADANLSLKDLADLVGSPYFSSNLEAELAPVSAEAPLTSDETIFYFQKADEEGSYRWELGAPVVNDSTDDHVTFYLLADTGSTGVTAEDITFYFNTNVLQFLSSDLSGSLFPYARIDASQVKDGFVRFVGAARHAIIGTHNYLASFTFKPIALGVGRLTFVAGKMYRTSTADSTRLEIRDFSGRLVQSHQGIPLISAPKKTTQNLLLAETITALTALFFLKKLMYRHI